MRHEEAKALADMLRTTTGNQWEETHTGGGVWLASRALDEETIAYVETDHETDDGEPYRVVRMSIETVDPDTLVALSGINFHAGLALDDDMLRSRVLDTIEWYETGGTAAVDNELSTDSTY